MKSIEEEFRVRIIPKVWKDPTFRRKLLTQTKEALEEMGISSEIEIGVGAFTLPPSPVAIPVLNDYEYVKNGIANFQTGLHDPRCNSTE